MKKKKNKNRFSLKSIFSDRYTPFQKMWIIILLILLCVSLVLTVWQIGRLALRSSTSSQTEKKTTASASPSAKTDSVVLAQTNDAGKEYVDNTLFLGDSNTVRFMNTEDENGQTYTTKNNTIAVVGMGVDAIDSLKCMEFSTGTYTMSESVKILQPQRIIITFGTNNLTGSDSESDRNTFIESYTKQLKKITEAYPSVNLIVNSIPPIAENTVYTKLDPKEIMHWNSAIEEMCRKNKWHYLNSFEALADTTTGYALDNMMDPVDGLHLSDQGLKTLFTYIRTHAYITEDNRPKPLNDIPEIIGCKTDMIATNPLTGSGFTGTEGGYSNNNSTYESYNQQNNVPAATESQTQEDSNPAPANTETQQAAPVQQPETQQQPQQPQTDPNDGNGESGENTGAETGGGTEQENTEPAAGAEG